MATETETKTFYPGAYDTSASSAYEVQNATNPVGKGSSNTTYATVVIDYRGYTCTTYWPFDVSAIPPNAVIDSVSCKAKARVDSTSFFKTATMQLSSGTTGKGSAVSFNVETPTTLTLSGATWTRAELNAIRLLIIGTISPGNSFLYFYGADLTVQYTHQSEKFMLKLGGKYNDIARVFKRVKGVYIEQTDLANVIEEGVRYVNGGEYIAPVRPASVTITGTGNSTYCYATINGTKYSGASSNIEVMPGDVITFGVRGRSSTYYGHVTIDGTQVLNVTNNTTQTYNWTVPDGVKTISIAMTYTSSSSQRNGRIVVTTS